MSLQFMYRTEGTVSGKISMLEKALKSRPHNLGGGGDTVTTVHRTASRTVDRELHMHTARTNTDSYTCILNAPT